MKLQILVNHYKEPLEIVWRLLHSIEEQEDIDNHEIEILICTDGYEHELTDTRFKQCRLPVQYFVRPHYGVCRTRNTLLDTSDADYLMLCDCDDMFSEPDGLRKLLECAEQSRADIVGSDYSIELKKDNDFVYRTAHRNTTRVHGKIFKRQYLIDQHLRFPDEMEFSGDMHFLYLAYHLTDRIVWLPDNFYIWKWMPESVTRGKTHYSVRTYDRMLYCYVLTMRELHRRGQSDLRDALVTKMFNAAYIDYFSEKFADAPEELSDKAKEAIRRMVREFYGAYLAVPYESRRRNYIDQILMRRTYGPPEKYAGIENWIRGILGN